MNLNLNAFDHVAQEDEDTIGKAAVTQVPRWSMSFFYLKKLSFFLS